MESFIPDTLEGQIRGMSLQFTGVFNGSQLAKMKKYIPYMSVP